MKVIAKLNDMIGEELDDAEKYAKKAVEYKMDHPEVADLMYKLSEGEMGHMKLLHDCVVKVIEKYRSEHGAPPEAMMKVYNYEHEKQISKSAAIKSLQAAYKD